MAHVASWVLYLWNLKEIKRITFFHRLKVGDTFGLLFLFYEHSTQLGKSSYSWTKTFLKDNLACISAWKRYGDIEIFNDTYASKMDMLSNLESFLL